MNGYVLLAALLPVAILLFYIYRKDKLAPEPSGQLLKAFAFGVLSAPLSMCMSIPFASIGLYPAEPLTALDSIKISFWGAAIPEEIAKFVMLWLLLRNNRHFDERLDGIVYAVCVSMGFAALENVMYLFSNYEEYLSVGISRALFAVPGHFCFAVLMGYYYSRLKFSFCSVTQTRILVLAAPILVHGLYDSILFIVNVTPAISGILMIIFVLFCHKMWKYARKKIEEMR